MYQDCERLSLSKLARAQMPYTFWHFLLKALHNVEDCGVLYIEISKVYQNFNEIPTFHNSTKLKLHSINSNWDLLFRMLNHCPNLQNGTDFGYGRQFNAPQNWVDPKFVPQCLSLYLKTCTIWYFEDELDELQLATYILNNARVLQSMKFSCYATLKKERELSLCSKASPKCELIFHVLP
ncbi:unnamed protein product [Lathyrus sativus]|nr:unnamed protein product [Lathyrus sativus]